MVNLRINWTLYTGEVRNLAYQVRAKCLFIFQVYHSLFSSVGASVFAWVFLHARDLKLPVGASYTRDLKLIQLIFIKIKSSILTRYCSANC